MIKIVWQACSNFFHSQLAKNARLVKDACLVFVGRLINGALGLVSLIILSRWLGPGSFGLFAVSIALMETIAGLSDVGGTTSLIRFASLYVANSENEMANRIYSIFFKLKVLIGGFVFIAGIFLARPLAEIIFHRPQLTLPFRIAFAGILGSLLLGFINSILVSNRLFGRNAILDCLHGVIKLLGILGLFLCYKLNSISGLSVYVVVPFVIFFIGLIMLPRTSLRFFRLGLDIGLFKKVFNFSKWVFLWTITIMLQARLDVFMLTALGKSEQVGFYYAAHKLAYFLPLILSSLVIVLLPRVSALKEKREFRDYIRKVLILGPLFLPFTIIALILAKWMVPILFGSQYNPAILLFQILLLSFFIETVASPASMVFLTMNKPNILFLATLFQLAINVIIDLLLIPHYKALGACIGFFSARLICAIVIFYFIRKYIYGVREINFA